MQWPITVDIFYYCCNCTSFSTTLVCYQNTNGNQSVTDLKNIAIIIIDIIWAVREAFDGWDYTYTQLLDSNTIVWWFKSTYFLKYF